MAASAESFTSGKYGITTDNIDVFSATAFPAFFQVVVNCTLSTNDKTASKSVMNSFKVIGLGLACSLARFLRRISPRAVACSIPRNSPFRLRSTRSTRAVQHQSFSLCHYKRISTELTDSFAPRLPSPWSLQAATTWALLEANLNAAGFTAGGLKIVGVQSASNASVLDAFKDAIGTSNNFAVLAFLAGLLVATLFSVILAYFGYVRM